MQNTLEQPIRTRQKSANAHAVNKRFYCDLNFPDIPLSAKLLIVSCLREGTGELFIKFNVIYIGYLFTSLVLEYAKQILFHVGLPDGSLSSAFLSKMFLILNILN